MRMYKQYVQWKATLVLSTQFTKVYEDCKLLAAAELYG